MKRQVFVAAVAALWPQTPEVLTAATAGEAFVYDFVAPAAWRPRSLAPRCPCLIDARRLGQRIQKLHVLTPRTQRGQSATGRRRSVSRREDSQVRKSQSRRWVRQPTTIVRDRLLASRSPCGGIDLDPQLFRCFLQQTR